MNQHTKIRDVRVVTIRSPLEVPIRFGEWEMRYREFAVCGVRAESGEIGRAFTYTRDAPLSAVIDRLVALRYEGRPFQSPAALSDEAASSSVANLSAGIGLRALGLVDLATWDLKGRSEGRSISNLLGEAPRRHPAVAIVGYPPSGDPEEVREQVECLHRAGWRRFKQAVSSSVERTVARMQAAVEAAPDCPHALDGNYVFRTADEVLDLLRKLGDLPIAWFEDFVPPGEVKLLTEVHERSPIPLAMGDDQGGPFHPDGMLQAGAIDVVRIDIGSNGGISRLPRILEKARAANLSIAPHMFAHLHAPVLSALGYDSAPIEWGVRGTGVDQYADSLAQPTVVDGMMEPLTEMPGFGDIINLDWVEDQDVNDPGGLLADLRMLSG